MGTSISTKRMLEANDVPTSNKKHRSETYKENKCPIVSSLLDEGIKHDIDLNQENKISKDENINDKWTRPDMPFLDPQKDAIFFQQIDIDYYTGEPMKGMSGNKIGPVPIFRMYGVTIDGNSICAHVHGFSPYFYVQAPQNFTKIHLFEFKSKLDAVVIKDMKSNKENVQEAILRVDIVQKQSIHYYTGEEKSNFIKITVALPKIIAGVKRLLEREIIMQDMNFQDCRCFESNIDFDIRFMVETKLVGCSWIEIPANNWRKRVKGSYPEPESTCQCEIDVAYDKFIAHEPEGEWSKVAPFRILSFDIECAGRRGIFPEPQHDPVIQIANMVMRQGGEEPYIRNVFTLNTCAPIDGIDVLSYMKESELLDAWSEFVRQLDPDIITGYNINNFDIPYLINRAKHLKVNNFVYLGRIKDTAPVIKETIYQTKISESRKNNQVKLEGRVVFDLLFVLFRDYKLDCYTLNRVSYHFLQEQKEDVHYSIITDLYNGTDQSRRRLAKYCLQDTYLPLKLLIKLMCIFNYMEMARVIGVSFNCLLTRKQQVNSIALVLRKSRDMGYLIPIYSDEHQKPYLSPSAYIDNPLYSFIIMVHNLCYTTLVEPGHLINIKDDIIKTAAGYIFVKPNIRKGLLPQILECFLSARKKIKTELKNETDPFKRNILISRQFALKTSANSIYSLTRVSVGKMPCLEISKSVIKYNEMAKKNINTHTYEYDSD